MPSSRRLRVSDPAITDLARISDYTERTWGTAQRRIYLDRIRGAFIALRDSPGMGASRDGIANGLRSHPVGRHVVFYRDTGSAVIIVRVLHASMDPDRHV